MYTYDIKGKLDVLQNQKDVSVFKVKLIMTERFTRCSASKFYRDIVQLYYVRIHFLDVHNKMT